MDNGMNGDFSIILSSIGYPDMRSFTQTGLSTGLGYRFYIVSVNYAGSSITSIYATFYTCLAPSGFNAPTVIAVITTTVDLEWSDPTSDGGCPLTGFSIYRDDGAGGSYTEVHAASLNGNPSLSNFQVTNF
jgi:hypothetical protein